MRRLFLTVAVASLVIIALRAQTAENETATIGWALTSGTITESPVYDPATASQFLEKMEITKGSALSRFCSLASLPAGIYAVKAQLRSGKTATLKVMRR